VAGCLPDSRVVSAQDADMPVDGGSFRAPRDILDLPNQLTQFDQLGAPVHQVAAQQHHIRLAPSDGIEYLPAQSVGTTLPEVNVAHIQQSIASYRVESRSSRTCRARRSPISSAPPNQGHLQL
jgi:hypothetical protein